MNTAELRNHPDYKLCMDKIRSYRKGFEFTLNYAKIPTPQANALRIIMRDAIADGLVESIALGLSLEMENTDETFRRL